MQIDLSKCSDNFDKNAQTLKFETGVKLRFAITSEENAKKEL